MKMIHTRMVALALSLAAACDDAPVDTVQKEPPRTIPTRDQGPSPEKVEDLTLGNAEMIRFVFLAVLEGLYEDGADSLLLKGLLEKPPEDLFVYKCPICDAVQSAMSAYVTGNIPGIWVGELYGEDFPEDIRAGLGDQDRDRRLDALESLVSRYVKRRFDTHRMEPEDESRLKKFLLEGKRFGRSVMSKAAGNRCANCTGATWWEK